MAMVGHGYWLVRAAALHGVLLGNVESGVGEEAIEMFNVECSM
jgi:hypothetical protein